MMDVSDRPDTLVVIPCYNESKRFDFATFSAFLQVQKDVAMLLVNDGSKDETQQMLDTLCNAHPEQAVALHLPKNVGKAEAVRQGILEAVQQRPRYVGFWDADLATPLENIVDFRDLLQCRTELDVIIGSRVSLLGRSIQRRWIRHLLGRGFATVASLVLKIPVYDTQCGAKMFRVTPQTEALFQQTFHSRWIFDVEILARMMFTPSLGSSENAANSIYEYPLECWREIPGSKLKAWDFAQAAMELVTIYRKYAWGFQRRKMQYLSTHTNQEEPNMLKLPAEAHSKEADDSRKAA